MIAIGLAGWGDHDELYNPGVRAGDKLAHYAKHYPIVEVDSTFYAIPSMETCRRWSDMTPPAFSFIVKAYKGLTGHDRSQPGFTELESTMKPFLESIQPFWEAGKLKAVLCQYPPWFDCTRENVQVLRETKSLIGDLPAALEFRHQSWFSDTFRAKTLQFMRSEGWIHSICDEPQVAPFSVPTVLQATHDQVTMVRMHGRNVSGWSQRGNPNWRAVRYLYNYNRSELQEWAEQLRSLEQQTEEICVVFNNNSGGDAASNAKQLMNLLQMDTLPLAPRQLDLFE
ncbi:DUF72 domain-containing protein [Paenibacillus mendelii]|uniref:DUF72 domain-containing protein n=1 Tax=Paenibacillus mendelii TaxID=206163 RepID=A0ABV6J3Q0_9BACL|nr:DUF72 domain-containing protein [Paenibacillus mendelii]MCQ6561960.1 DUF72 domain-containing protein [Paenibacillus mendelii]